MNSKMALLWHRTGEAVLLFLAFVLPLAFYLKTYDSVTIKTATLHLGTIVLVLSWFLKGLERGRWEVPQAAWTMLAPALGLLAWTGLRFALSEHRLAALPGFLNQIAFLAAFCVALLEYGGADNARRLTGWTLRAAWIACLYGLAQKAGWDPFAWKGAFGGRVFSTFADPDALAQFLALCLPLAMTRFMDPERDAPGRVADMALASACAAVVVLTGSASGLAALAIQGACFAVLALLLLRGRAAFLGAALGGALTLGTWALALKGFPSLESKFFRETGPVGALLGLALFGSVLLNAWRSARRFREQGSLGEATYAAGLSGVLLGALLAGFFCPASRLPIPDWLLWPLAGMLGGLSLLSTRGPIAVLPLPCGEKARRLGYAPSLAAGLALGAFPVLWFGSDLHHNAGVWHARQKHWDSALAEWDLVRRDAPAYVMAAYFKGNVFADFGKPEDALRQYALVESLSPGFARVDFQKGLARLQLWDWAGAEADFERAVRADPDFPPAYRRLSQAALAAGHTDLARRAALTAVALEPAEEANRQALAAVFVKEKRGAEARRVLREGERLRAAGRRGADGKALQ